MKRRDIGKLLLIGLAAAGLQGCSQTAETTAADVEKPQVQTEAETDAASETKTAEAHTWQFTYFGTSTNEKSNTMAEGGSLKNGISLTSCTVKEDGSIDKKGGKFAAGEGYDGISFYYTVIDPETENFRLKADVTIDYINPKPDGQEGVAIIARDSIGEDTVADCSFFTNSAAVIGSSLSYYDEDGTKTSMKDGIGYRMITGVESDTTPPEAGKLTLDSEAFDKETLLTAGETYTMELRKTNTGYEAAYYDKEGNEYSRTLYGAENLNVIDNSVYAGFAVARGCNATFNNIEFEVTDPAKDAPAEERPVEKENVSFTFLSSNTSGSSEYPLSFKTNADGTAVISDKEGNALDTLEVKAEVPVKASYPVKEGENHFIIAFTPKEGYKINEYTELANYGTVSFDETVSCRILSGDTIFISKDGTPDGTGTKEAPIDLATAFRYGAPGQSFVMEGGTYTFKEGLTVLRGVDGTEDAPIVLAPVEGERAVLDFAKEGTGLQLWGDYWHIKNIDVCNASDGNCGIRLSGHHNILEGIKTYNNGNTGLQVSGTSEETIDMWPSDNLILNCTSYNNCDEAMEDADGFAAKLTCGEGNVFRGCIAAYNADDGWDLFAKIATGKIGAVTIEDCVAFKNGYVYDESGSVIDAGNGNGFKMGGSGISGHHVLKNSITYENKAKGIDSNSCPDIEIYNNVSFNNEGPNIAIYTANRADTAYVAEGNISYGTGEGHSEDIQLKGQDASSIYSVTNYFYHEDTKAYENSKGEKVTDDWFVSLDTTVMPKRAEDGSLLLNGLLERK